MTKTQIIWSLRKRTIKIATEIIEAVHKARPMEESDHTEETQSRIIGQNKTLLEVLNGIKGGEDVSSRVPKFATGEQIVEMAHEIEKQIKLNARREPDEACIRAIYQISLSEQRAKRYTQQRATAIITLMDFTGAEEPEIKEWIETARKLAQIETA